MVKLIQSGLRKDRAILLIFMLIMILSSMLMHTGLLASNYKTLYDRQAEKTHLADYLMFTTAETGELNAFFDEKEFIRDYSVSDMILMPAFKFTSSKNEKEKTAENWIFQCTEGESGFSELAFVERDDSVQGRKIYLNLHAAYSNHLCTGDTITVDSDYGKYECTVAGVYQHLFMGGNSFTSQSAMLEPDTFDEMKTERDLVSRNEKALTWRSLYQVHIKDGYDAETCLKESKNLLVEQYHTLCNGITTEEEKGYYTSIVNILAAFMGAFAVIVMLICLIIIIFTINNNISRDVTNIGALKAVGHTTAQIRAALTAEYLLLGLIGSAVGIVLSYLLYPVLEYLYIRILTGMVWEQRFFPQITCGVLFGVLAVTVITAFLSTFKIRSLHPATALRFGLQANSFKKNHLPLSETNGELNFLLAIKSAMQNKAQNIIVFCIIFAVSFAAMFSGVLYYNTKVDISNFQRMVQGDIADGYCYTRHTSAEAVGDTISRLKTVDGISDAYAMTVLSAYIGEQKTNLVYVSEPAALNCLLYEGVMLQEENEAVLGITLAEKIGAGVGDEVELTYGDTKKRFLVTGLQQSALNNRIYIHEKAAGELGITLRYDCIRIRVKDADNEKVDAVLREGSAFCSEITGTENRYRYQHSDENTPVFAIGLVVLILAVLMITTVLLVIRLLLKTVFVKKEKEFGIKKAVGFTSTQLRCQLALSLLPTTLVASAAGAVTGYFGINPLFALVLSGYGIKNSDLIIRSALMVIPIAAVTILVFIFSFAMSGKMKKLSAYKLIQE